jgi:3-phosphoshikimate 1-carboxyvinyltransferase
LLDNSFEVQGGLKYRTQKVEDAGKIGGDWSAAAVAFCVAAVMGKDLKVGPLDNTDGQPDVAVLEILKKVGCAWRINNGECHFDGCLDEAVNADLLGCPDLAPPLAALAVFAPGVSILRGLRALPNKESDRLGGIINLVEWLGGRAELLPGPSLKIYPALLSKKSPVAAKPFDPMDDHRLAFAAAIGSLKVGGTILNMECVNKSWPGFWQWAKIK